MVANEQKHVTYSKKVENASRYVDLRSDTGTKPSKLMKEAMVTAELGDDVYGEDPTTNSLQERCAKLFGKEAGLFCVSGTMGNLLAIMAHCQRGDELITGRYHHVHRWEQGNYAQIAGVSATTLEVKEDGTLDLYEVEESIRVLDKHMPTTKLICIENTQNFLGGKALSLEYLRDLKQMAERRGVKVHMDGARIYNAAVQLGCSIADIAQYADSVQMCFSKGLGAPIGSILVGSKDVIEQALWRRKAIGGGWRQSGVLAAAAHVALDHAVETITADHRRAKELAEFIQDVTPESLKKKLFVKTEGITNMVVLNCEEDVTPSKVVEVFKENGVLVMGFDAHRVRLVFNWNVDDAKLEVTKEAFRKVLESIE